MADGTSETGTAPTETCQVQQADECLQLSSGPSRSCPDERTTTAVETFGKGGPVKQGQEVLNESEPKQSVTVPPSDFTFTLERHGVQHDIEFAGEATAMFDSPAGGSTRPPSSHDQPKDRTRRVTYASFTASPPQSDKGPLRRDSSYYSSKDMESDGSEVEFTTQAKELRARERMVIRRQRVQRTRRLIRSCRERVHKFRDEVRDIVDLLARRFNERKALEQEFKENIEELCEKLQVARDKLGPAEDEYDDLERRLESEEDDLEEEEELFFNHNNFFDIAVPEARLDIPLSPLSEPSRPLDSDPDDLVFEHELVRRYLKKLEEAEDLKEDMDQLENEYLEVSEKVTFRRKHHIPLSEESTTFLYEEYPKLCSEIIKDLRAAEDALFKIRDQCIEEKLFTESDHKYQRWDTLCDDLMELVHEACNRSPIRAAAHSLDYNDRYTDFGDKKDYVNKWILQWIEESTVGTMLLQAWIYFEYPEGTNKDEELGDEKWSALAVENWDSDKAGDSANKNNRDSRLDTITGVNPTKIMKRHAASTGRSVFSSSLGTLDVIPDVESDSVFYATPQTPLFHGQGEYIDSEEKMPSMGISQKTISQSTIPEKGLEISPNAAPAEQEAITYTADELSASLQSTSIESTGEDTPSQSSYPYTESRSNPLSTAYQSDNGIQQSTAITASATPEEHLESEAPNLEYQDDLTDTPRRLPVHDRDEDVPIPYMTLVPSPEAEKDQIPSLPPSVITSNNAETMSQLANITSNSLAEEPIPPSTLPSSKSSPNLKDASSSTQTIAKNSDNSSTLNSPLFSPIPTITTTLLPQTSQSLPLPLPLSLPTSTPTPTSTNILLPPLPPTRQRSKSESRAPINQDRTNYPAQENDRNFFLSSPAHTIRHRRSLSPTSLLSSNFRRIEGFGLSWRQGDFL